jgi:hypothetical protein
MNKARDPLVLFILHPSSASFDFLPSRRSFLLRIDPAVLEAVQRWADDDLRSLNGQIEFLLRRALRDANRARPDNDSISKDEKSSATSPDDQGL